jgi:hypothetical protein
VVRGPAAVLALVAAAQAYVLAAPDLPTISPVDLSIIVACSVGAAAIYVCIWAAVPLSDVPPLLWLVTIGAFILVFALNVADVGAGATPIEALAYAAFGGISTFAGGPSELLANAGQTQPGDPLSLEMPDWGNGLPAGRLGISDAVFAGVFLVYARRFGLRPRATAVALWVATVVAIVLKVWLDQAVPVLPLLTVAYFVVNADRIPALLRLAGREAPSTA